MSIIPRSFQALSATAVMALLGAPQAWAHAHLTGSDPAANATVSAPKVLHLQFSEALAKKFSSFTLSDANGHAVALTVVDNPDSKVLEATPNPALTPGVYTVSWTSAASDDGHRMTGHYNFTVK